MSDETDKKVSCITCPSYLTQVEATRFFVRGVGSPMCAQFGKVLSLPPVDENESLPLLMKIGSACPSHGKARPTSPPEILQSAVLIPDGEVLRKGPTNRSVKSCMMCSNFISADKVNNEFGWTSGACAATGKLIPDNRAAREAKDCSWASPSMGDTHDLDGMVLLQVYEGNNTDPVRSFLNNPEGIEEPSDHATDREVTEEDEAAGIMAWRKVADQRGTGKFTYLPIFNIESFSEEDRSLVPATASIEHPEWYVDTDNLVYTVAVAWMELDETPVLWGQAGVGKTELLRHIAWLMQVPFARLSITDSSEVDDVIGKMVFVEGETRFQRGRLTKRWERPGVILVDEPNTGPDALWQRMRPMTDNSKQFVLDEANGEVIERHMFTFLGMAMNPSWDRKNIGAKELSSADADRLTHVHLGLPSLDVERKIIERRVSEDLPEGVELDVQQMKKVMKVAADIRTLVDQGTLPISWGIRPNIKAARLLTWFDPVTAYRRAVADNLDPETGEMILNIVRTHMGR